MIDLTDSFPEFIRCYILGSKPIIFIVLLDIGKNDLKK